MFESRSNSFEVEAKKSVFGFRVNTHPTIHPKLQSIALAIAMTLFCGYKILAKTNSEDILSQFFNVFLFMIATTCMVGVVTSDLPIPKQPRKILGEGGYEIDELFAPNLDGFLLKVAAKLISNGWIGHLGARPCINLQGLDEMRELAAQAGEQNYPVIFYPLRRNTKRTVNDNTCEDAIQQGISRTYDSSKIVGVLDYHQAYSEKKVTPTVMMFRVFEAMDKFKFMNMFVEVDRDKVLEQARASDERWAKLKPLSVFDGVPVAIKDATVVKGHTRLLGLPKTDADLPSEVDDTMVRRLREAGAIVLGVTVTSEFGRCPLGYNSHFKGPFNPYDENCYTGGSSSGSVAAVMTGIVPIAVSFDAGGSIRIPASFCGAFGLAPTYGRVPTECDDVLTSGNIHSGVNTATTTDTALAYALLAQNEPNHIYSQWFDGGKEGPPRPTLEGFDRIEDMSDVRVGVFWDYFNDCDPFIRTQCTQTLQQLINRGAKVVDINIPNLNTMNLAHEVAISIEMSHGSESDYYSRNDIEPAGVIQLAVANNMSGIEYLAANRIRGWAMDYMEKLFKDIDVIITPGCPITAPPIPKSALAHGENNFRLMQEAMRYVFLVNLVGIPGMTIPIGYAPNGLPISIQFMSDHWNDALLLRLSHFVEKKILKWQAPKNFVKVSLD